MDEAKRVEQAEGAISFARVAELEISPVKGNFGPDHLREIHRRIFQDLPHHRPGEHRPDAPAHIKGRMLESTGERYRVHYARGSEIGQGLDKVLGELGGADGLRGLDHKQFADRMAKLYGDLDQLHPFQEGNSRTLRTFTKQLAREAGYTLDWSATNADAQSRDRLYVARDVAVLQRTFPGLTMRTAASREQEFVLMTLMKHEKAPKLDSIVLEATAIDRDAAKRLSSTERSTVLGELREDALKRLEELSTPEQKQQQSPAIEPPSQAVDRPRGRGPRR